MSTLLKVFVDICLLRAGPQTLPKSVFLLGLCLILYGLSGLLLVMRELSPLTAIGQVLVDGTVLLLLLHYLLRQRGLSDRFVQTATAAVGTGALLGFLVLPASYWLVDAKAANGDVDVASLALTLVMVWSLVVLGHVLREAISSTLGAGVLLALAYMVVSLTAIGVFFPYGT